MNLLCVLVRCDTLIVAIPAASVTRIALADEVRALRSRGGVLWVSGGEREVPAWQLDHLLGLDTPIASWLFLGVADGAAPPALAIGAGRCVAVRPLPPPEPLPAGLFRRGGDAISGVFRVDDALRASGGIVGLWLDPVRLIGGAAIAAAVAAGMERR